MARVSRKIIEAVKLSPMKSYEIAHVAGLAPCTVSRLLCGIDKIKDGDDRVVRIGRVVGVPADACFEKEAN